MAPLVVAVEEDCNVDEAVQEDAGETEIVVGEIVEDTILGGEAATFKAFDDEGAIKLALACSFCIIVS